MQEITLEEIDDVETAAIHLENAVTKVYQTSTSVKRKVRNSDALIYIK